MINHWMFRCRDVSEKVSRSLDDRLPLYERLAIRFHLMMCRYCARFDRQVRQIRELCGKIDTPLPGSEPTEGLSEECKNRINAALRARE